MFFSVVILGLYLATIISPDSTVALLIPVNIVSALIAAIALIGAIVCYFVPAPSKNPYVLSLLVYMLLVSMIAVSVASTGGFNSPLVGLWIAAIVFAGVFGFGGYLTIILYLLMYVVLAYVNQWVAPFSLILLAGVTLAPLIASFIIWHPKNGKQSAHDRAYNDLASELSHEANKSDTVIGAINDGVVSVDKKGVIQLINPAAQRIIGWGREDAIGLSYKSVVKLHDKNDVPLTPELDPVSHVLLSNQEVHSEDFSITTAAGKKVLLSLIVSPIGKPSTGAIMVFRDMTKEKSEEREQAEFISTASHEMRTPVASIEGYLGLALNPATATIDDKARDYIQKAQASAQHLGRLFQDLLDVSKADDGRMTNNPKVVDVVQYIGDIVEGLRPKAVDKGLRFLYKPSREDSVGVAKLSPVFYAHVDNDHLRELISNLTENAIKYTHEGDVIIDVNGDDHHIRISIQDSGIGIPTEDLPHLFQKFYRVDNTDTREIGGTGLGLYLCRRLAELMGGQVLVESEYKRGSTFTLEIPRIDPAEAQRLIEAAATTEQLAATPITAAQVYTDSAAPIVTQPQPQAPVLESPQPQTTTAPATPATAQPVQPPVSPNPPAQQQSLNTPLSQIEQNPGAYVQSRPTMQIPARDQQNINQS